MGERIKLSKDTYKNLATHLAEVKEGRNEFIVENFPEPSTERLEFECMLDDYIEVLDDFINKVVISEKSDDYLPFVMVGSEVKVEELSNNDIYSFHIVKPSSDKPSDAIDEISFLSPVGSSLLLKKVGDKVRVDAPKGTFYYKVKSINFKSL